MKAAGKLFGNPTLYRAALSAAGSALEDLPRFAIYNWFNAWGRQREVPQPPPQTFRQWYIENRGQR
jgi:L-lactate dehydrogenase complex protein LldF